MTWLLGHVGTKWDGFSTILLAALAVSGGIFLLYLKTGGDRAFRRWILHVAKPAQDEAWARLHQAMDMGTPRTTHERCSDLVSGLDDWWSSLERSKRPLSWVSRSKLPLVLVIITSAFSLAAKRFHDFVGEVSAIVAMACILWFIVAAAQLVPWLMRHGLPENEPSAKPETETGQPPPATA